ncbi:hypothetical protein ABID16_000962 [Rhizobium aquaticum]|uniref:Uncharacterized protein n=1 Tax=Rhizobium aquaticum TaxID=1549636 RepID=A0ABV2IW01_9HYPH
MIGEDKALAEKIGAVLIEARRYSSFVNDAEDEFHKKVRLHCRKAGLQCHEDTTTDRVAAIFEQTQSAFRSAAFEARCYESFRRIWIDNTAGALPDEISHLTHHFGHRFPLSLYIFSEYLGTPEFRCAFPNSEFAERLFEEFFPRAEHARHAVAHESDRNLGKSVKYVSGKKIPTLFEISFNQASISDAGYKYVDRDGQRFELKFSTEDLELFWQAFCNYVRSECV